jgi:hypothetical protein
MFEDRDAQLLLDNMRRGEIVLFAGAGLNHGSTNANNQPIKTAEGPTELFRRTLADNDADLSLSELYDEVEHHIGTAQLHNLLRNEFEDCTPSSDLISLLQYTWYKIYTLNIDDCNEKTPRQPRAQRLRTVNRNDRPQASRTIADVEVVHLNGFIKSTQDGFIFSPQEYRRTIRHGSQWYSRCAETFIDKLFVFLGTELDEPIFDAYVEDLLEESPSFRIARSFLIKPSLVGPCKRRKLETHRVTCVAGTLHDFVQFLQAHHPHGIRPSELINEELRGPTCARGEDRPHHLYPAPQLPGLVCRLVPDNRGRETPNWPRVLRGVSPNVGSDRARNPSEAIGIQSNRSSNTRFPGKRPSRLCTPWRIWFWKDHRAYGLSV